MSKNAEYRRYDTGKTVWRKFGCVSSVGSPTGRYVLNGKVIGGRLVAGHSPILFVATIRKPTRQQRTREKLSQKVAKISRK